MQSRDGSAQNSLFVVLEGGEGAGKSLQAEILTGRLRDCGRRVLKTAEPGGEPVCAAVRAILLDVTMDILPVTEMLLYAANRAQHAEKMLLPAFRQGKDIVCDRHLWSSLAYQGYGRELSRETIFAVNQVAIKDLPPPFYILLDISPEVGFCRLAPPRDRIETDSRAFHKRVRRGFLELARMHNAPVVDASSPVETVSSRIWEHVVIFAGERGVPL